MALERFRQKYNLAKAELERRFMRLIPTQATAVLVTLKPVAKPVVRRELDTQAMEMLALLGAPDVIVVKDKDDNGGWG